MKAVHFFLVLAVLIMASCSKEVDFKEVDPAYDHYWNIVPRDASATLEAHASAIFQQHLTHYLQADPIIYLPVPLRETYRSMIEQERSMVRHLGLTNYLQQNLGNGTFSSEEIAVYQDVQQLVSSLTPGTINTFGQDLQTAHDQMAVLTSGHDGVPLHLYTTMQMALEWYVQNGGLQRDGDCSFGAFLQAVLDGAAAGDKVAKEIAKLLGLDDPNGIFGEAGEEIAAWLTFLGPVVGVIIEVWEFFTGEDCNEDCTPVTEIGIVFDPSQTCNMTRTLHALGAGSAATGYVWEVKQGGQTVPYATIESLKEVTQNNPNVPMIVRVRPACQDNYGNFVPEYEEVIDLAPNGPLGEVGSFSVVPNAPSQQYTHSDEVSYVFGAAGHYSGNIVYTVDVPSGLGEITYQGENYVDIQWSGYGTGQVTFTATNVCSGAQSTETIHIQVSF